MCKTRKEMNNLTKKKKKKKNKKKKKKTEKKNKENTRISFMNSETVVTRFKKSWQYIKSARKGQRKSETGRLVNSLLPIIQGSSSSHKSVFEEKTKSQKEQKITDKPVGFVVRIFLF